MSHINIEPTCTCGRGCHERVAQLEGALREGGCQFYMDGEIGYCQKKGETNPCAACAALDAARPADTTEEAT
jgi:hypothetical protein